MRVEKSFRVDVHRFGVFADFQNLLNSSATTAVQTRVPDRTIQGNVVLFESPTVDPGEAARSPSADAGRFDLGIHMIGVNSL